MPKVSIIAPLYNAERRLDISMRSIAEQTHRDIEVIMVDDGSKDRSVELARRWCEEDSRFRLLENGENKGVSATRNRGLDIATGEYVRFIDADDTIPRESTKQMLNVAEKHDSDLVIGIMRRETAADSYRFARTVKLAQQETISRYDESLNYSFSVCNKLFKREVIERERIRFEEYKLAEDGLFLFSFIAHCNNINGCNEDVYSYYKSEAFEEASSSDVYTLDMLRGILEITDKIQYMNYDAPRSFYDNFISRIVEITLVQECYRKLWNIDEATEDLLIKSFNKLWAALPENKKKAIRNTHRDLRLEDRLLSKREITKNPLFTITISRDVSTTHLDKLLTSLYGQKNPSFVIYAEGALTGILSDKYADCGNVFFMESRSKKDFLNEAIDNARGEYIIFIEDDIAFSKDALANAAKSFEQYDFLSEYIEIDRETSPEVHGIFETICSKENSETHMTYDAMDIFLSNKIFSVGRLRELQIKFTDDRREDLAEINTLLSHRRVKKSIVYLDKPVTLEEYKEGLSESIRYDLGLYRCEKVFNYKDSKEKISKYMRDSIRHPAMKKILFIGEEAEFREATQKIYEKVKAPKEISEKGLSEMSVKERDSLFKRYKMLAFEGACPELDGSSCPSGQKYVAMLGIGTEEGDETDRIAALIEEEFAQIKSLPDHGVATGLRRKKALLYSNKRFRTQFFRAFGKVFRKFVPMNEKAVLFLSDMRSEMGGNMKYVYDYLPEGYKAYFHLSSEKWELTNLFKYIALIYRMNRCKYILLEDFFTPLEYMRVRKGQEIVQLWHGAGAFKRFAYGRAIGRERLKIHSGYKKYTKAIVSSPEIRGIYSKAYNIEYDRVQATGVPRTDLFFDKEMIESRKAAIYAEHPELKDKKIVLIAPTYRGTTLNNASYDFSRLGLSELKDRLRDEYVCITAWHPAVYNSIASGRISAPDYSELGGFVMDLSHKFGTDDLMLVADVMITDYSSIIFDYSLLDKPIIFYAYDMELYAGGRGLYYDFEEYIYGQLVTEKDELADAILNAKVEPEAVGRFREKFMSSCDGHAAQRTADYIFNNHKPSEEPCEFLYSVVLYSDCEGRTSENDSETYSESLKSIAAQSFDKKRIQLVSADIHISDDAAHDFGDYIYVNREEGVNTPALLNKCLDACKGELVVFLREGDIWDASAFENAEDHIEKNRSRADIFLCDSEIKSDKSEDQLPQFIRESISGLMNLRSLSSKINQLEGSYMIRRSGICGVYFNENLKEGYMQTFYTEAAARSLMAYYMKNVHFTSYEPNNIVRRKRISKSAESYSEYIRECYQRLIKNDIVLYGAVTKYLQDTILKDIDAGIPGESETHPMSKKEEWELEGLFSDIASYMDGGALGDTKGYNAGLGRYISQLKTHGKKSDMDSSEKDIELWTPLAETIEQEDFKILIIRACERHLHLEGCYTAPYERESNKPELFMVGADGTNYVPLFEPASDNDVSDALGRRLARGFTFTVDLPANIGDEYTFCAGAGDSIRRLMPFYGAHSSFPPYLSEGRVRDSEIIIRRSDDRLIVAEPSENMKKRIEDERKDNYLTDVISFVTVRGSSLQENLSMVCEKLDEDIPKNTFAAMRPHNSEQLSEIKNLTYHSKVVVTDDYIWLYREREKTPGQKLVQLWHACGAFKKFGADGTSMFPSIDALTHQYYDMVSVSSEHLRDIYADAFRISKDKVKALGVPRTDIFFNESVKNRMRDNVYRKHPEFTGKQLIVYAPTFRDNGQGSRREFIPDIKFDELSEALGPDRIFAICPHPVMTKKILQDKYANIMEVRDLTTNEMMMVADFMITDYSSVIFEFSLLGKPMAFYCYDYDDYDRDFYLDYQKDLPGPILRTQKELHRYILEDDHSIGEEYKAFKEKYMGACDGHSTERISRAIEKLFREG